MLLKSTGLMTPTGQSEPQTAYMEAVKGLCPGVHWHQHYLRAAGAPGYSEGLLGVPKASLACFSFSKWEASWTPEGCYESKITLVCEGTGTELLGTGCCSGGYSQYPWQAKSLSIMG